MHRAQAPLRGLSAAGTVSRSASSGRVTQDFDEGDARWLHAAVESLCEDDLAKVSPAPVAPEVPGMVAEERAPYGAGPQEPSREEWVSLH